MKRTAFLGCMLAFCAAGGWAQDEARQAVITGKPGTPKCTIEVEVDVVADVEVHGTIARLHTLSGSPATWRRFECNQPMPQNPVNFRFRGIDGRGRQTLVSDPGRAGVAVVRIEDQKSGREGYTFDLEWGGPNGPAMPIGEGPQGYPPVPPPLPPPPIPGGDPDRDRYRGDRFDPDYAIHRCADSAIDQLRSNGYSGARILDSKIDGQPGRGDWIYGIVAGQRGRRPETFNFACPVDFQARRVGNVNLRPANDGYYGPDSGNNRFTAERAVRACREAVQDRLSSDNYASLNILAIDKDDRPGNNDVIVGRLTAQRDGYTDNFDFSCSADFEAGRIRSVNVNRRWNR